LKRFFQKMSIDLRGRWGNEAVPELLTLENVNAVVDHKGRFMSLLEAASERNDITVVRFMLDAGVILPKGYRFELYGLPPRPDTRRIQLVTILLYQYYIQYGMTSAGKGIAETVLDNLMTYNVYSSDLLIAGCITLGARFTEIRHTIQRVLPSESIESYAAEHFLVLAEKRQTRCHEAVLVIMGCFGRWRRIRQGTLKDVAVIVSDMVWETRRTEAWTDEERVLTNKKKCLI
jgi:hypothetical protein